MGIKMPTKYLFTSYWPTNILLITISFLLLIELGLLFTALLTKPKRETLGHILTISKFISFFLILAYILLGVHHGRNEFISLFDAVAPSNNATFLEDCFGHCITKTHAVWGNLFLAFFSLLGLAQSLFLPNNNQYYDKLFRLFKVGAYLSLLIFSSGIILYYFKLIQNSSSILFTSSSNDLEVATQIITKTSPVLITALNASIVTLLLFSVFLIVRANEFTLPQKTENKLLAFSVVILSTGLLSYFLTRSHAEDISRRFQKNHGRTLAYSPQDIELPQIKNAKQISHAPAIQYTRPKSDPTGGMLTLDIGHGSAPISTRKEIKKCSKRPSCLFEEIKEGFVKSKKHWQEISPDNPFPTTIDFYADRNLPMNEIAIIFKNLKHAGYQTINLATIKSFPLKSSVLKNRKIQHLYGFPIQLTDDLSKGFHPTLSDTYEAFCKKIDPLREKRPVVSVWVAE